MTVQRCEKKSVARVRMHGEVGGHTMNRLKAGTIPPSCFVASSEWLQGCNLPYRGVSAMQLDTGAPLAGS